MTKGKEILYDPVEASPVKSFFVSMLTRDIKLEDAILDLLDNCVDGIMRSHRSKDKLTPYRDYFAQIKFDRNHFCIHDNCGGIPWNLHNYAFRMGRTKPYPKDIPGSVGVYGIGMKRAIFKMGRNCLLSTQNGEHRYEVEISPEWILDEELWRIPVKNASKGMEQDGTTIYISELYDGIADRFGKQGMDFKSELERMVSTHYAFIIDKGFEIKINDDVVKPKPTKLIFDKSAKKTPSIQPFIFQTRTDEGVDIFLAVGFTRPIPTQNEIESEQEEKKYSTLEAGWTILCNDRAVLYCDRSEMTGWGDAGIPRYHTQFIAVSGIVEFRSDDASLLPTTTTKRGIDGSSPIYLQVKNKMREGMRMFTDYTNKWKGRAEESKRHIEAGTRLSLEEIKKETKKLSLSSTPAKSSLPGKQYKPKLPLPLKLEPRKQRISFIKDTKDIEFIADYLFSDVNTDPSEVGEKCFDVILKEARK